MRTLIHISSDADVYQPVNERDIKYLEKALDFTIPAELKEMFLNPNLEFIIQLGTTLLWPVHHGGVGILDRNISLRSSEYEPFPLFIIAFATNECGDFWVIDNKDYSILYIGPDEPVEKQLNDKELHFKNFSIWLEYQSRQKKF